jgi:iron complex outermembrane recepter protein
MILSLRSQLLAGLIASCALTTNPTWAQQPARAGDEVLEEVIVTVERRQQNLQDVASLAQAFDAEDLKMAGVGSELRNLSVLVPGLNIANQEGNIEVFIRGVGTANNTELGDPSAATHINGVYLPRPRGVGAMFFDLERVEINKGPQGTLRGRNAVAGTLNVVTKRPQLGELDGYVEAGFGDYNARTAEGAVNLPVGDQFAVRLAGFFDEHDSYFRNAGLAQHLRPAGEEDERAGRVSALWQPSQDLSVYFVGDYIEEGGTGYPGSNMFATFTEGFEFDDVDPRAVVYRGWQGDLDSEHWGAQLTVNYDFGPFGIEYSGSHRDLDFSQVNAENDNIAFPGRDLTAFDSATNPDGVNYDNWGNVFWLTRSESQVHELRLLSPSESRTQWTTGVFYFEEDQQVGFFSTTDNAGVPGACCFSGTEFTMPDVASESLAAFADATFSFSDTFRIKGGLRFTEEEKSRFGIGGNWQVIALGGAGFDCCFGTRFSTPGFVPLFLNRPSFDVSDRSREARAQYLLEGATFGARDTLQTQITGVVDGSRPNGTCVDRSDVDSGRLNCVPGPGGVPTHTFLADIIAPEQQFGTYEDDFLDWRIGAELDLSDDNLLYATITTGHKSGGFNDTVLNPDFDDTQPEGPNNPRHLQPLQFQPEEVTAFEIGSKNRFGNAIVNASAFLYDYKDQVFQVLTVIGGTGGINSGTSQQNVNVADSTILGVELETSVALPYGFRIGGNLLWLDTEIDEGLVSDVRATNFANLALTPDVNLKGNELPKAPELTLIGRVQQVIEFAGGSSFDWQVLANYQSDYFLTIFNETDVLVDGPDADDEPDTLESAHSLGFDDKQKSFVTVNVGAGYTTLDGALRVEGYVANVFDEDATNKAQFAPGLNLRFLNDPRTMGVRLRYRF